MSDDEGDAAPPPLTTRQYNCRICGLPKRGHTCIATKSQLVPSPSPRKNVQMVNVSSDEEDEPTKDDPNDLSYKPGGRTASAKQRKLSQRGQTQAAATTTNIPTTFTNIPTTSSTNVMWPGAMAIPLGSSITAPLVPAPVSAPLAPASAPAASAPVAPAPAAPSTPNFAAAALVATGVAAHSPTSPQYSSAPAAASSSSAAAPSSAAPSSAAAPASAAASSAASIFNLEIEDGSCYCVQTGTWQFATDHTYHQYEAWLTFSDAPILQKISDAFTQSLKFVSFNYSPPHRNGGLIQYDIDFNNMTQSNMVTGFKRRIRINNLSYDGSVALVNGTPVATSAQPPPPPPPPPPKAAKKRQPAKARGSKKRKPVDDESDDDDTPAMLMKDRFPFSDHSHMSTIYPNVPNLLQFDSTGGVFPSYWPSTHHHGTMTFDVPVDSVLGKEILGKFASSLGPHMRNYVWPSKIVGNCHKHMMQEYMSRKRCFIERNGEANEVWAWHGTNNGKNKDTEATSKSKINAIFQTNYDRKFSTTPTSQVWGAGTYFAKNSEYSFNGYCYPYDITKTDVAKFKTKHKLQQNCILLNMVLLGKKEILGDIDYWKHKGKVQALGVNSMVGDNDAIYVLGTGTDHQVFPAFVIYFESYKQTGIFQAPNV